MKKIAIADLQITAGENEYRIMPHSAMNKPRPVKYGT